MLDEIRAWFKRCVALLRLDEYEIVLAVDPSLEALGTCVTDPTYQAAAVTIRDPRAGNHPDWKRSTLHELVHVRMGGGLGTEPGSEDRAALERGVEMMTRILYRMIMGGASDSAVSRVAAGCARSLQTAREGTKRGNMNGARIAEIAMALGGMELPDEAKALVTELIGLASGGDMGEIPSEKEPMIPDDKAMVAMPEAYRKELSATMARIRTDMSVTERASIIGRAKVQIGEKRLKPVWLGKLNAKSTAAAREYLEGLTDALPTQESEVKREEIKAPFTKPGDASERHSDKSSEPVILAGEDATKIPAHVAQAREALARAFGTKRVNAVLSQGGEVII